MTRQILKNKRPCIIALDAQPTGQWCAICPQGLPTSTTQNFICNLVTPTIFPPIFWGLSYTPTWPQRYNLDKINTIDKMWPNLTPKQRYLWLNMWLLSYYNYYYIYKGLFSFVAGPYLSKLVDTSQKSVFKSYIWTSATRPLYHRPESLKKYEAQKGDYHFQHLIQSFFPFQNLQAGNKTLDPNLTTVKAKWNIITCQHPPHY